jgi:thiamine pyrophosphokinase
LVDGDDRPTAADDRDDLLDTIVVVAGGPEPAGAVSTPAGALVIAADGGAEHALRLGLAVDVAVGDCDSISPAALAVERAGARLERHPRAKDATDLELALDLVLTFRPRRVLVIGSGDGRADHALGQLLLLASDAYQDVDVDARLGRAAVHVVRRPRSLVGVLGELVSLFALHGPAEGVVTEGLQYPLRGETLVPGSSRGVSNAFAAEQARVTLARGVLLAVQPGDAAAT